jgi:tRNA/rRNA methyltransferase
MTVGVNLDNVAIVLVRPRIPENIGAAARAMRNMGINELIVVDPQNCDLTRILRMATHAAIDVVEEMTVVDELDCALEPFHFVIGTTARKGKHRQVMASPAIMARRLIPLTQQNRVALLFGPEDRGLSNADARRCQWLVNIPTAGFSSLNLAQAVMVCCYELFNAGMHATAEFTPRLATQHELDGMYEQVKEMLIRIDFIKPDNPDYWLDRVRHFFTRMQLRAREVSIIRGICRQMNWYAGKRYQDGKQEREME